MRNPGMQINIFQAPSNVSNCSKCEVIISKEEGCGCSTKHQSSEEQGCGCNTKDSSEEKEYRCNKKDSSEEKGCECNKKISSEEDISFCSDDKDSSSSEETICNVKLQSSEESCEYNLPSQEEKEYCNKEVQTSKTSCSESSEEYSEETSESSEEKPYSSEEFCSCRKQTKPKNTPTCSSSEESSEVSKECCQYCINKKYESSEEIQTESSEEYFPCPEVKRKSTPKKKCESSEELLPESSEEIKNCDSKIQEDSGEIHDEEHWCKGRPIKINCKRLRYSNSDGMSKRFSRYRRELFLDDMQDFSVYTEPLTRNEMQKTIAKIRANSTSSSANKRKRKGKKRQRNQDLVQNKDQFEEHNKLKQIFEAKTIDAVEDKTKFIQDDEDVNVNGKPNQSVLESNPKQLEQKLEDEILLKQNEERNKRHSQCRTIEHLKKNPKYRMNILADAGCSQYIPEIITEDLEDGSSELDPKQKYYDYLLANRNKRHLSTFDGNTNYPIKFVDATKRTHPFHLKKIQYRRHHHPKHSHEPEIPQNHDNFAVDPKYYYKYLSLTAPDLSSNHKTKSFIQDDHQRSSSSEDKKIVYDHLGHKFLEYNGFRTLIKPKIEYADDTSYEKPKFWTCKEDLIDPKDFGKVTTISEDFGKVTTISEEFETTTETLIKPETTIDINLATEEPNASTTEQSSTPEHLHQIEDLEEHELNLCEYLKKLETSPKFEAQEAKNTFLHNCESYIKFLIFNPSNEDRSSNITDSISKYLENLLHNSHIKHHVKKLFHTKHKFENNLANITKLLHKPKVVENFKNYLLFQNEFDSMKSKLNLKEYTINYFYIDLEFVLNHKLEKITSTTETLTSTTEKITTSTEKLSTKN